MEKLVYIHTYMFAIERGEYTIGWFSTITPLFKTNYRHRYHRHSSTGGVQKRSKENCDLQKGIAITQADVTLREEVE